MRLSTRSPAKRERESERGERGSRAQLATVAPENGLPTGAICDKSAGTATEASPESIGGLFCAESGRERRRNRFGRPDTPGGRSAVQQWLLPGSRTDAPTPERSAPLTRPSSLTTIFFNRAFHLGPRAPAHVINSSPLKGRQRDAYTKRAITALFDYYFGRAHSSRVS